MAEYTYNFGRPREYDRMKIVKDFVDWAYTNPNAFTVPQFTTSMGFSSDHMIKWSKEDDDFLQWYRVGKELIGINRLNASINKSEENKAKMDKSIYMQTIGNFDFDIKNYQHEEKIFEESLKAKDKDVTSEKDQENFKSLMNQFSKLLSERNIEDKSNNAEQKS